MWRNEYITLGRPQIRSRNRIKNHFFSGEFAWGQKGYLIPLYHSNGRVYATAKRRPLWTGMILHQLEGTAVFIAFFCPNEGNLLIWL